jgi:N-acyl-L-homoserine lactone synthetase
MSQAIVREGHVECPLQSYSVEIADSAEAMRRVLHLRYMEYCVRMRSLNPVDYPDKLERDPWDAEAISFAAYHRDVSGKRKIVGCTRLVRPSVDDHFLMERRYPDDEGFELPSWIDRGRTLESSRLIARTIHDPSLGTIRQWFQLLGRSCEWSLQRGFTHWVVASQEAFFQARSKEGWPFIVLGEPQEYHHTTSRPVVLNLLELYFKIFEGRLR